MKIKGWNKLSDNSWMHEDGFYIFYDKSYECKLFRRGKLLQSEIFPTQQEAEEWCIFQMKNIAQSYDLVNIEEMKTRWKDMED